MKLCKIFFILSLFVLLLMTESSQKCYALGLCSVRATLNTSLAMGEEGTLKCVCLNGYYGRNCRFKGKLIRFRVCLFLISQAVKYVLERSAFFILELLTRNWMRIFDGQISTTIHWSVGFFWEKNKRKAFGINIWKVSERSIIMNEDGMI